MYCDGFLIIITRPLSYLPSFHYCPFFCRHVGSTESPGVGGEVTSSSSSSVIGAEHPAAPQHDSSANAVSSLPSSTLAPPAPPHYAPHQPPPPSIDYRRPPDVYSHMLPSSHLQGETH